MFAKSSNSALYDEAARSRLANRSDLPKKPPRRQRIAADARLQGASNVGSNIRVSEPLLPTPKGVAQIPSRASKPAHGYETQVRPPSPKPSLQATLTPRPHAPKAAIAAPKSAAKSPQSSSQSQAVRGSAVASGLQASQAAASAVQVTPSQDMMTLPSPSEWDKDNTHLDDVALLTSIQRLSQDVEMIRARLLGDRRSRQFTPESANRSKFIRVNTPPPQPDFSSAAADSSSGSSNGSASSSSGISTESPGAEYDSWDVERYVQARQFTARQRFWHFASTAAKEQMVRALYDQPAGSHATIQARENGWIPS